MHNQLEKNWFTSFRWEWLGLKLSCLSWNHSRVLVCGDFCPGDKSKCFSQGETAEQFCERAGMGCKCTL
eukprot:4620764-Amphidinium_carterae.1